MSSQHAHDREQLGYRLSQVGRLWRAEIDKRLAVHGLTEARWRVLLALSRAARPLWQKDLAEHLGVQGPTLVRTIDWLEGEGLVERRSTDDDRRAKAVHLTPQAEPSLARIQTVVESVREEIFQGIAPEDIKTCLGVLDQITANLSPACCTEAHPETPAT